MGRLERIARKAENAGQFSAAVGAITALNRMMALGADQRASVVTQTTSTGAKKGPAQPVLPPAPAVQLLFTPVVEMSPGGSYVVAVDTAAV